MEAVAVFHGRFLVGATGFGQDESRAPDSIGSEIPAADAVGRIPGAIGPKHPVIEQVGWQDLITALFDKLPTTHEIVGGEKPAEDLISVRPERNGQRESSQCYASQKDPDPTSLRCSHGVEGSSTCTSCTWTCKGLRRADAWT